MSLRILFSPFGLFTLYFFKFLRSIHNVIFCSWLLTYFNLVFGLNLVIIFSGHLPILPVCCYCSVAKLYTILCNPLACGMLGSFVLHYLLEFAQIHVHWAGDIIILCHTLLILSSVFPVFFLYTIVFMLTNLHWGERIFLYTLGSSHVLRIKLTLERLRGENQITFINKRTPHTWEAYVTSWIKEWGLCRDFKDRSIIHRTVRRKAHICPDMQMEPLR